MLLITFFSFAWFMAATIHAGESQGDEPPPSNPNTATQPDDLRLAPNGWPVYMKPAGSRMRALSMGMLNFATDHGDRMPHDIGSLLNDSNSDPRAFAEICLTPGDERRLKVPDNPTADWINQNTSYVYLAADVDRDKIVNPNFGSPAKVWGATVMYHTRLDQPFSDSKHHDVVILTYIDGHSQIQPIANAKRIIQASKLTLEAGR